MMNKMKKVVCACCGKELSSNTTLDKCICLTIYCGKPKRRIDYCYECGVDIASAIGAEVHKIRQRP